MKPNKQVTKRIRSRSRKQSGSRKQSRSKRAGAAAWAPAANNSYRALTAPSATAKYFGLSPTGVPAGGFQPPVPEMRGPGMGDINPIHPPMRMRGGLRRSNKRAKKGGYILGALPEMAGTMWNNAVIGIQNVLKGIQGLPPLHSASPWIQPELVKPVNAPLIKPFDVTKLQQTAAQRVANV